jgi:hypothetical protein
MPFDKIHQQKKYKNYTLLFVLLFVVVLFFGITMVKFSSL